MKKIVNLLICVSIFQTSLGQDFQGNLSSVSNSGLHKIALSPEVRSYSKDDISHIRIYDSKKNEIPFAVYTPDLSSSKLIHFPFISKNIEPNVSTSIIVSNADARNINGLILKIANTDVAKKYNIYGSNDNETWFGLVNNHSISNLNSSNGTFVEREFSFPMNDYKFLKFEFIDKKSLPINVIEAYSTSIQTGKSDFLELKNFTQEISLNKKDKQTKVLIMFDKPQVVDKISFNISEPNFYLRNAEILVDKIKKSKRHEEHFDSVFTSFMLDSKKSNQFEMNSLFTKEFSILIDNGDNPELKINSINLFQTETFIIADLKASESYLVVIDPDFKLPNYDLSQSEVSVSDNLPTLSIIDLSEIKHTDKFDSTKSFWQTPIFMWICIVLAVLILGFFTISMIKDMGKEK